ncbi:hypothetical protein [Marinitoga litoralis]|uniref:hypothetical protein n=1 Tax=Marinitoga litoralis TaxID=570855 RepID=UPI001960F6C6|nr:hypothetical protein [Marinitoga litoralis]MBM7559989.1 RNA polymerase-binding transcription factor DksA [Marinitoga litoralis]
MDLDLKIYYKNAMKYLEKAEKELEIALERYNKFIKEKNNYESKDYDDSYAHKIKSAIKIKLILKQEKLLQMY